MKKKKTLNEICFKNSLLSFSQSLMKYYGLPTTHDTHAMMDYLLTKKYRHVAVILLDGLGKAVIEGNCNLGDLFMTHQIMQLSSVYPPTTVAATTTVRTGLSPLESGYLGWALHLQDDNQVDTLFMNKDYYTKEDIKGYKTTDLIPAEPWYNNLKRQKAYSIWPKFMEGGYETFDGAVSRLEEILNLNEQNFTYLYWDEPDATMHEFGPYSPNAKRVIISLQERIEKLNENLPNDTCIFIIADHGMIDIDKVFLDDYPTITSCLRKKCGGEARSIQFYVTKGKEEEFVNAFNAEFAEDYILYTKKEYIKSGLMIGKPHPTTTYSIGDYVAVATSAKTIMLKPETDEVMIGHHAGLTKEELMVPVIMLKKKETIVEE